MKICSICHKISGTDDDHLDCKEKRRVDLEDVEFKQKLPEKLDLEKNGDDLAPEIKALLEHMIKERESKD